MSELKVNELELIIDDQYWGKKANEKRLEAVELLLSTVEQLAYLFPKVLFATICGSYPNEKKYPKFRLKHNRVISESDLDIGIFINEYNRYDSIRYVQKLAKRISTQSEHVIRLCPRIYFLASGRYNVPQLLNHHAIYNRPLFDKLKPELIKRNIRTEANHYNPRISGPEMLEIMLKDQLC